MCSCTPQTLRQAQQVVVAADSLWTNGQMFRDSAQLAQAYESLGKWQILYADEYAHACYHYGRLLRELNDPVSAMQAFIDATHSHTRDYHILGRVYNNIGDICHIAGDFDLSYSMFEQSAIAYLKDKDTLSYYFSLNDMAFEKAMLADKEACLERLNIIRRNCSDKEVICKTMETRAELFFRCKQYDSVLYIINHMDHIEPTEYGLQARALWHLGKCDSALMVAKYVMTLPNASNQQKYNMLYILIKSDSTLLPEEIKALSEQRADIEAQALIPLHKRHAIAANLLLQDISRKPNLMWVYIICLTLLVIFVSIWGYIRKKRQIAHLADQQAENIVESIKRHIDTTDIKRTLHWNQYEEMKVDANLYFGGVVNKLELYSLNEIEIRFCILTILDFRQKQIAETIHYSYPSGIKTLKKRISDKLGTRPQKLRDFLLHMPPQQ